MSSLRTSRQTPKQSEARRCTETFRDLLLAYKARMESGLRGSGFTLAQLRMLKAIEGQHDASAASIARTCHITPQTLQSMLTRATREGWIQRGLSPQNARIVTATLTPKGSAILAEGQRLAQQIEADLWHGVSLAAMQVMRQTAELGLANLSRG